MSEEKKDDFPAQETLPEHLFPERGGNVYKPSLWKVVTFRGGHEIRHNYNCEWRVAKALENSTKYY